MARVTFICGSTVVFKNSSDAAYLHVRVRYSTVVANLIPSMDKNGIPSSLSSQSGS